MGFCTSPLFGELALEILENICLNKLKHCIVLYNRYVDDCLLIIKGEMIDTAKNVFNDFDVNLQVTCEFEKDKKISFLDLELERTSQNSVITNWYRKNTASGRFIHFSSHHPIAQKRAIVYNLVDKSILLSHEKYHKQNLDLIRKMLADNAYPTGFVNKYIDIRVKKIEQKNKNCNLSLEKTKKDDITIRHSVVLPYIKNISFRINRILRSNHISPIYSNKNKLNNLVKLGKDITDINEKTHIIYKIDCSECSATYIGQSKRKFCQRVKEHQ